MFVIHLDILISLGAIEPYINSKAYIFLITRLALVPPKPKELDNA